MERSRSRGVFRASCRRKRWSSVARIWRRLLSGVTGRISFLPAFIALLVGAASTTAQGQAGCAAGMRNYPCVYVANDSDGTVSVISSSNSVIATINLATPGLVAFPQGVAVTPDNASVYVAGVQADLSGAAHPAVWVLSTATSTVATTITDKQGLQGVPSQVAITPNGKQAWVAEPHCDGCMPFQVQVIDTATNQLVQPITIFTNPTAIAFSPDGTLAYVADDCVQGMVDLPCVDVLDTASYLPVNGSPILDTSDTSTENASIAVTPDGKLVCMSVLRGNFSAIAFFQASNNTYLTTTQLSTNFFTFSNYGFGMTPGGTLYAAASPDDQSQGVVDSISTASQTFNGAVNVGKGPAGLAVSPDGTLVYVTNSTGNSVSVIQNGLPLGKPVPVGNNPQGVATMPTIFPIIITQPLSQTIGYLQTATLSVAAGGSQPLTYQWFQGMSGDMSMSIPGATNNSFTTPPLSSTTNYWVLVSNAAGGVDSNTATITVTVAPPVCGPVVLNQASPPLTITASVTCTDPQGEALSTTMNWGDNSQTPGDGGSLNQVPHTYDNAAIYTLTVTATNTSGLQGTATGFLNLLLPQQASMFAGQSGSTTGTVLSPGPVLVTFECTTIRDSNGNINDASTLGISCSSLPPQVMLNQGQTSVTIVIQTTGLATGMLSPGMRHQNWLYAMWLTPWPLGFLAIGWGGTESRRSRGKCRALAGVVVLLVLFTSCGGGFTPPKPKPATTTPPGSYQVTVVDLPVGSVTGFVQTTLIVPLVVERPQ